MRRPPRLCEVDGCGRPVLARGWCRRHYTRWYRHGSPHTLARGQDPDDPRPCPICHGEIVAKPKKVAPTYCSRACRNRARYVMRRLHALFLSRA